MDPYDVCRPPFEIGLGRASTTFLLDLGTTDNHLPPEEPKNLSKTSKMNVSEKGVEGDGE